MSLMLARRMKAMAVRLRFSQSLILPSFTFVSTANAFIMRGAYPKFVDVRPDTLNIDEGQIADAVSERTKVIVPVHYGGVAARMDPSYAPSDILAAFLLGQLEQIGKITRALSRLVRLPMHLNLARDDLRRIVNSIYDFFGLPGPFA